MKRRWRNFVTWIPVHFRVDPPPIECAGVQLLAHWAHYAGKEVLIEHINARDEVRRVNDEPLCDCEHLFRVKDYVSANGQQAVVCQKCLEMD